MHRDLVPEPTRAYLDLRSRILSCSPEDLGMSLETVHRLVWGAVMEIGFRRGPATIACLANGAVSVFLSPGPAIIGAGAHADVRDAASRFLDLAEDSLDVMSPSDMFQMPEKGCVSFHVLTFEGPFTTCIADPTPSSGEHRLSPLFEAGNRVLERVRSFDRSRLS